MPTIDDNPKLGQPENPVPLDHPAETVVRDASRSKLNTVLLYGAIAVVILTILATVF